MNKSRAASFFSSC